MTDKEIMQKVLDALDLLAWCENPATRVQVRKPKGSGSIVTVYPHKVATDAAALLRERMAQPEPGQWREVTYDQLMEEVRSRGYEIRDAKIIAGSKNEA